MLSRLRRDAFSTSNREWIFKNLKLDYTLLSMLLYYIPFQNRNSCKSFSSFSRTVLENTVCTILLQ